MKAVGVKHTAVGFMGGHTQHPSYKEVCEGNTGHIETTEVEYDDTKTNYDNLVKLFFETHDFTKPMVKVPILVSSICLVYSTPTLKKRRLPKNYIQILTQKGYKVATMLKPASTFWKAEDYHQQYYEHKGTRPYCHAYKDFLVLHYFYTHLILKLMKKINYFLVAGAALLTFSCQSPQDKAKKMAEKDSIAAVNHEAAAIDQAASSVEKLSVVRVKALGAVVNDSLLKSKCQS